jgi:predicted AAA+ superfamily ATPase
VRKFSYSLKEQVRTPRKCYIIDNGFRTTYGFKFSEDRGKTLENTIFLELARRKTKDPLMDIFYWQDYNKREVDFVVTKGKTIKTLIQACADVSDFRTKERETLSLVKISKELKCRDLIVITLDYDKQEKIANKIIVFKPLWKWLIEG